MTLGDPVNINLNRIVNKKGKSYYIGERHNPQFKEPYYIAYGQLSKAEAKKKEKTVYGSIYTSEFATLQEYENKIDELQQNGFRVRKH